MFPSRTRLLTGAMLALVLPVLACADIDPDYVAEIDAWHAGRQDRLRRPEGWLALVGLHSLDEGANPFGSGPENRVVLPASAPAQAGVLFVEAGKYRVEVAQGIDLTVEGKPVTELALESDAGGAPTILELGPLRFHVIERVGQAMLRVKDGSSPLIDEFEGIERWPVDTRWRVEGRFEPYDPPKILQVPNVMGYVEEMECAGAVVFELEGRTYRLDPQSPPGKDLFLVFADETNGEESYGGGRFVYCDPPDEEGRVIVDFNLAYNPPCVFTPYATCPLPTDDDTLDLRITAGEKMWEARH